MDSSERTPGGEAEAAPPAPHGGERFPVVGVGASAGGIEALEGFLRALEPSVDAAFVIILHLDPSRPSMAAEILGRSAQLPVREAVDGVVMEPGNVYVIPSNATLALNGRRLAVSGVTAPRHASIDAFFTSLAAEIGEAAIGVVLSGSGSDGAAGLRAVKDHGGITFAQDPEEARSAGMPRAAIALGAVDCVARVAEMPAKIVAYGSRPPPLPAPDAPPSEDVAATLRAILTQVLRKTGHDFAQYKQATMLRRVQRRIRICQTGSLSAYADLLRGTPAEVDRLFNDLLIGVTSFFRDPEVFAALAERVIPAFLKDRVANAELRLWVAGCATGEEAYSLAILVREALAPLDTPPPVKLFATDIHEAALELARQGRYPASIAADVSPERLARFFRPVPGGFQVNKEVRDLCVFSTHNIVGDPPFSKLDLLSCRNLLIYLESEIQAKLVPLFHYALAPGGYLVLGPSENLAGYPELFRAADREHRIFQRLDTLVAPTAIFPITGPRRIGRLERAEQVTAPLRPVGGEVGVTRAFERLVLDEFAPPAVLVNAEGKILYVSGPTGRFLQLPAGMPRTELAEMAPLPLRSSLYTALHRAIKSGKAAEQKGLAIEMDGTVRRLDVIVRPLAAGPREAGLFAVVFRETSPPETPIEPASEPGGPATDLVAELKRELYRTRESLQTTIEELEIGGEELQSTNEELLSTNEELQSANEELQTSKEEQQSINEELQTVNVELVRKVEELDRANGDLKNLFASTRIATLFLDGALRIQRFSPAATELLRVIDSDVGRPVSDIASVVSDGDLVAEVREVLATLTPSERPVYRAEDDRWYSRRIRPYRSVENVIDGVVITFVDVTELKRARDRLAGLAAIVESSLDAIVGVGLDGVVTTWNGGAERVFGYAAREAVGMPFATLFPPEVRPHLEQARREHVELTDVTGTRKDGSAVDLFLTLSPVRNGQDEGGEVFAISAIAHDVTEPRRAQRALRRSEDRFRRLSESGILSIAFLDRDGRIFEANAAFLALTGVTAEELAGGAPQLERLVLPEVTAHVKAILQDAWTRGRSTVQELDFFRGDGSHFVGLFGVVRLDDGADDRTEGMVFMLDVTERRRAVDALRRSEERLGLAIEGTWELDTVTGRMTLSPRARVLWALTPDEAVRYESRLNHVHPDEHAEVEAQTRRALNPTGPREYRVSYRVLLPGGETRWIESWGRAFFTESGGFPRPLRVIGTLLDVTERKRSEEALKDADRRKDLFLATLGHELRNPLGPIGNAVHVMGKASPGDPAFARAREILLRQVRHMTHLLDDLLDVGRLAAGKISLRKDRVDLVTLVRATVDERLPEAEAAGLALTATLPDAPLWIVADPTRIAQSVSNLLVNAVKFTPRGGHVTVEVAAERDASRPEGGARVTVSDDGVGIDPEMLDHLFERFAQADRSIDRSHGGLGLGLSLVRSFATMHEGSVTAESEGPGKGARFTLRLPLAPGSPPAPPPASAPVCTRRILVVEDNADAAELMQMTLELAGHEVAVAHSGAAGVALARTFHPAVVLCDIGLPGELDGYGVAGALRADPALRDVHIVALTGYGQEEDKRRAREAGFDQHLTKPIAPELLDRVIAEGPPR